MFRLDAPIHLDISGFLRWWGSELSFLVPAKLKKLLGAGAEYLVLVRDEQGLSAVRHGPDGDRTLGHFSLDEAGVRRREQLLAETPELAEIRVLLRLTSGQALRKTVRLPAAAEENLLQVLAFEMDRLTPFKSDQVYYGARILDRIPATRQLTVELALVPKQKLDALLEELVLWGWQPEGVDLAGDHELGTYDLLPEKYRPARSRLPATLNAVLAGIILVLAATLAVLPIWVDRNLAQALEEQVRKASKTAKEVETLRQEAEKLAQEMQFLQNKKRVEPVMLDMLEELTRVIPDNTWLNGLQYKDRRVVIQGQSPSASSLIERIEASPHFRNTSFVSPVTKDITNGLERFQIASDVINGRFSEKPSAPESE